MIRIPKLDTKTWSRKGAQAHVHPETKCARRPRCSGSSTLGSSNKTPLRRTRVTVVPEMNPLMFNPALAGLLDALLTPTPFAAIAVYGPLVFKPSPAIEDQTAQVIASAVCGDAEGHRKPGWKRGIRTNVSQSRSRGSCGLG